MSPEAKARRLVEVRDDIDTARRLVECGWMAVQQLDDTERVALGELLDIVNDRLQGVVDGMERDLIPGTAHVAG